MEQNQEIAISDVESKANVRELSNAEEPILKKLKIEMQCPVCLMLSGVVVVEVKVLITRIINYNFLRNLSKYIKDSS